jgi:hypothetical protein
MIAFLEMIVGWLRRWTGAPAGPSAAAVAEAERTAEWAGRFHVLNKAKETGKVVMRERTEGERLLADLATGVWRLRQRITTPDGEKHREEMRRVARDVESMWDTLQQAGVEVLDHTGALYDPGQALTVLAFQPTDGIDRERIVETVKPTVYYQGNWLVMGEVIVGTPAAVAPAAPPP